MDENEVITKKSDGIKTIIINREDRRNAVSPDTVRTLARVFDETGRDKDVRAVILTGAGSSFSAGADLKWVPTSDEAQNFDQRVWLFQNAVKLLYNLPVPTIAAIRGHAVGYGFSLALACDIRIAADDAKLGMLFTKIGLMPDGGASYFLSRLVGTGKALELTYTADVIDAAEALKTGIVNKVVRQQTLEQEVNSLAQRLAKGAPVAFRNAKAAIHAGIEIDLDRALEKEVTGQVQCIGTADFMEGVSAFLQKRTPAYKGE